MAVNIHIVTVEFIGVNPFTNQVVDKGLPSTSIADVLASQHEHRVLNDPAVPNSSTRPTVKKYLEMEAEDDYKLQYMDQNTIITYEVTP